MSTSIAPSPFFEGTNIQYAWDSTSLGMFKECPRMYYYRMIENWAPRGISVHLIFGQIYHSCLEHYEHDRAAGLTHDEATSKMVFKAMLETWVHDKDAEGKPIPGTGKPWDSEHNLKTRENLVRSLVWYVEQFQNDPAKTVILASGKPAVELSFKLQIDDMLLCGHLDRVVEFQGSQYVMDHKTATSTVSSYYFDQYNPDNQMTLYTAASQIIYQAPVKGVIINAVQIAVGFSRFERGFTYRTTNQINEWLHDTREYILLAARSAERNHWPMNDKSCHKYGGCPFRRICSKDPEVRQEFLKADFVKKIWNPLEIR